MFRPRVETIKNDVQIFEFSLTHNCWDEKRVLISQFFLFPSNRLRVDMNGGAWCPKHMVSRNLNEYLQLDLLSMHSVTSIKTQGRFGRGQGAEFTEAFVVEYWRPSFGSKWKRWRNIQGKEVSAQLAVILKRLEWAWKMEKVLSVYCWLRDWILYLYVILKAYFFNYDSYTPRKSLSLKMKRDETCSKRSDHIFIVNVNESSKSEAQQPRAAHNTIDS